MNDRFPLPDPPELSEFGGEIQREGDAESLDVQVERYHEPQQVDRNLAVSIRHDIGAAKRWNSARRVQPTYSGVYEFRSTIWPDLTALDFDQRKGWGKFLCLGPTVIFRRYRPRLLDAWRGRESTPIEEVNMQDEVAPVERWRALSQAPADLVDGWYRIDPDDRFGPYAQYARGRWLVMLKTGERCELPWSALEKFRFDANDKSAGLALPESTEQVTRES